MVSLVNKSQTRIRNRANDGLRAGRLLYSPDVASAAQRAQVIFLAEDDPQGIEGLALKVAQLAKPRTPSA